MAIFKYPSKQAKTPRYSVRVFKRTLTDLPSTAFKKSDGDLFFIATLDVIFPTSDSLDSYLHMFFLCMNV